MKHVLQPLSLLLSLLLSLWLSLPTQAQTTGQNSLEKKAATGSTKESFTLGTSQIIGRTAAGVVSGFTLGTGLSLAGSTLNATASSAWADLTGVPANLTSWAAITRASGVDTFITTPSSANLAATVTNETGSGSLVFSTLPTFVSRITTPEVRASSSFNSLILSNVSGTTALEISGVGITANINIPISTASTIAHFSATRNLESLPLATYPSLTELSYVKGVTSAIQTQLNATTNASNITSGSLALARIAQSGATNGQAIAWDGTAWAPATIASGATLAANTFSGLQQFSGTGHAGIRLNNLTTAERDALSSPAAGMAIWNTTASRLQLHNGSAWTAGMVRLDGDSMTGGLTISSTTSLLLGTAGSAVGNIGFRNATSGTATLAPPTGALGTYTVTLPNTAGTLINGSAGTVDNTVLRSDGTGGGTIQGGSLVTISDLGDLTAQGALTTAAGLIVNSTTGYLNFNNDAIVRRGGAAATLQFGSNTATDGATAIGQTIKGPNATGTTSTGGSLTIAGGTGTSAGGAVILAASATTGAPATAVTVNNNAVTTFAKPPVLPVYTVATLPATAAAGMVQGAMAVVTDAQNSNHHSNVTGGGSTVICVFYDGTNWKAH